MLLVKFSAIDCINEITNHSMYISKICKALETAGLVSGIIIETASFPSGLSHFIDELEDDVWKYTYSYKDQDKTNVFKILFAFKTYASSTQIEIEISSDNYTVDTANNYLEQLKLRIKKEIKADWEKIIWLYDKDSEILAVSLYPIIYSSENLMRQLISEVMNKEYGAKWWNNFVPLKIKAKHKARSVGYKTVVPGFNNIDERLLSVDVEDLKTILKLQLKKWDPKFNREINDYLSGKVEIGPDKLKGILEGQMIVVTDLWSEQFSKYLPENFTDLLHTFELNRNHVAHNKLIDRSAYQHILSSAEEVKSLLLKAFETLNETIQEAVHKRLLEEAYAALAEEERMKSEAGVEIRNIDEIIEFLDYTLLKLHSNLVDDLRFREDIEITDYNHLHARTYNGILFEVKYKITDIIARVDYELNIDDSPGVSSIVDLSVFDGKNSAVMELMYTNGNAVFDDELGYYMPETADEIIGTEEARDQLIEFINENLENLREQVDSDMYSIIKAGGTSPVAEIPCCECGKEYICIDENYAPLGICLNCGEPNEIRLCDRCESYYEGADDGEVSICPCCLDNIAAQ